MPTRERWTAVMAGLCLALLPAVFPPVPASLLPTAIAQPVLRIGAIPDQNPEKLNRLYGLVADELSQQLGVKVAYVPVTDYTAAVSAFRTGSLDLVWFGGLTGVQASLQKPGAQMLAQRDIDAQFYTVFIANARSGLKPIQSQKGLVTLKGKRFTFGSESSTSGRLMPQYFLAQAGVKLADFAGGAPGFSGSHDATIALVQSGTYDAGVSMSKCGRAACAAARPTAARWCRYGALPATPTTSGWASPTSTSASARASAPSCANRSSAGDPQIQSKSRS